LTDSFQLIKWQNTDRAPRVTITLHKMTFMEKVFIPSDLKVSATSAVMYLTVFNKIKQDNIQRIMFKVKKGLSR